MAKVVPFVAKGGPVLLAKGGILLMAEIGILYLTIYNRCDKCSGFYIHVVLSLISPDIIRENLYNPLTIPL